MRELFQKDQALEWVLYIAKRLKQPTLHGVLKMGYFADKLHLERYGFAASGDWYCAMEYGPVGSKTFDMLKAARGDKNQYIDEDFYELVRGHLAVDDEKVIPKRDADLEHLSPAAMACLDDAIARYGHLDFKSRTDESHDAAWTAAWESGTVRKEIKRVDIAKTLPNAKQLLAHMTS